MGWHLKSAPRAMIYGQKGGRNGFDGVAPSQRGIPGSELPLNDRIITTANNNTQLAYAA